MGTDAFSGAAGELRYLFDNNGDTIVQMDVDGDGAADMNIRLTGQIALDAGDFNGVELPASPPPFAVMSMAPIEQLHSLDLMV